MENAVAFSDNDADSDASVESIFISRCTHARRAFAVGRYGLTVIHLDL